jgi:pilus assembly protein Flp/PilA
MTSFTEFLRDETGSTAAEYAFILGIIGGSIVVGATAFGEAIAAAFSSIGAMAR